MLDIKSRNRWYTLPLGGGAHFYKLYSFSKIVFFCPTPANVARKWTWVILYQEIIAYILNG